MNLLIFGDSITQGYEDSEYGGWANRLHVFAMQPECKIQVSVFNLGIAGDCTNRLLARFDAEASTRLRLKSEEDVIIFAIGVNDTQRYALDNAYKTTFDQFLVNIETLYKKAQQHTSRIIFVGLLPIIDQLLQPMPWAQDRSHDFADVIRYDEAIKSFCLGNNCLYIPMRDVLSDDYKRFLPDGIHPNADGHRRMFERVKEFLLKEKII